MMTAIRIKLCITHNAKYEEDFSFVDRFQGSVLHSNQDITCQKMHMNFVSESACLMANNIHDEIVEIHISQVVLIMLSLYINCFISNHRYDNPSCT